MDIKEEIAEILNGINDLKKILAGPTKPQKSEPNGNSPSIHDILMGVCTIMEVSPEMAKSKLRYYRLVLTRQIISYIGTIEYGYGTTAIGKHINRDHSTVVVSVSKMHNRIKYEKGISQVVKSCSNYIRGDDYQDINSISFE